MSLQHHIPVRFQPHLPVIFGLSLDWHHSKLLLPKFTWITVFECLMYHSILLLLIYQLSMVMTSQYPQLWPSINWDIAMAKPHKITENKARISPRVPFFNRLLEEILMEAVVNVSYTMLPHGREDSGWEQYFTFRGHENTYISSAQVQPTDQQWSAHRIYVTALLSNRHINTAT